MRSHSVAAWISRLWLALQSWYSAATWSWFAINAAHRSDVAAGSGGHSCFRLASGPGGGDGGGGPFVRAVPVLQDVSTSATNTQVRTCRQQLFQIGTLCRVVLSVRFTVVFQFGSNGLLPISGGGIVQGGLGRHGTQQLCLCMQLVDVVLLLRALLDRCGTLGPAIAGIETGDTGNDQCREQPKPEDRQQLSCSCFRCGFTQHVATPCQPAAR